ncbi:MAG: hypothetical protein HN348_27285, partial [Proteobacteria bacterium]|nr:hypothetical protein [Pseudomonadota bacterium]
MKQPLGHHLFALGLTIAVNVSMFSLFFRLNAMTELSQPSSGKTLAVVDFTAPPPPKRRPRPQTRRTRGESSRVAPRVLNLPSGIQALELLDGLSDVDLLGAMLSDEVAGADLILAEDEVDRPPEVLTRVSPTYPESALDREIEGW